MTDIKQKQGILGKIKSLLNKSGQGFRSHKYDHEITEKIALRIQRNAYNYSIMERKKNYTAPYKLLLAQMQSEDSQIFKAAVYNLTNIALTRSKYKTIIKDAFIAYLEQNNKDEAHIKYVRAKLNLLSSYI